MIPGLIPDYARSLRKDFVTDGCSFFPCEKHSVVGDAKIANRLLCKNVLLGALFLNILIGCANGYK